MSSSGNENEFLSHVIDLMQSFGPASARRMFGCYGIFLDDLMFALVSEQTLYLKADRESENEFRAEGLQAFTYIRQGKTCALSYFQAPEEVLEHPETMYVWANKAYAAAIRSASAKRKNQDITRQS